MINRSIQQLHVKKQTNQKLFNKNQSPQKQKGVALVIALIITTIALVLASSVVYRQQLHIRLTGNISNLQQAYQYSTGMEDWAGTILEQDYKDNPKIDSLDENWATLLPPIPIPGGTMNGQLFDLQARINLNSLALKPTKAKKKPKKKKPQNKNEAPIDIAKITRKQINAIILKVDPDEEMGPNTNFADIVKDWIDADQVNGNRISSDSNGNGGGAESPYYQSLETPYFSASTPLINSSELLLLKNMNSKVYDKLLPYINTLPLTVDNKPVKTPINVNTASKDIFEAIGFNAQESESIISFRDDHKKPDKKAFTDIKEFTNLPEIRALFVSAQPNAKPPVPPLMTTDNLSVSSNFFLLQGVVKINHTRLFINSILYRKKGKVSVIMRDFSNPNRIATSDEEN